MNDTQWITGLHHQDSSKPASSVDGERMYTLFMRDFFKMPNLDFAAVAAVDRAVRALFN